jgi:large subunit ribosomal protein L6
MATQENIKETVALPEGVSVKVESGLITVTGPKGETSRKLLHPRIQILASSEGVEFFAEKFTKVEKKLMKTYVAHVKNLFKGVTQGHEYKLKICSGHFPMNVSLKGNKFEVKNFIGESVPRTLEFKEGVTVNLNGDQIVVTGINKELVSQAAASIEQLTRRTGFDRRRFQDGIYIVEKDGKEL